MLWMLKQILTGDYQKCNEETSAEWPQLGLVPILRGWHPPAVDIASVSIFVFFAMGYSPDRVVLPESSFLLESSGGWYARQIS